MMTLLPTATCDPSCERLEPLSAIRATRNSLHRDQGKTVIGWKALVGKYFHEACRHELYQLRAATILSVGAGVEATMLWCKRPDQTVQWTTVIQTPESDPIESTQPPPQHAGQWLR